MNRSKSYRLLIVLLFFAFISLISRSLIYLIISLTIAILIILLLSKDIRKKGSTTRVGKETPPTEGKPQKGQITNFILLIGGIVLIAYGITGYFHTGSTFAQFGLMINDPFLLILAMAIGGLITIYSFIVLLKKYLEA